MCLVYVHIYDEDSLLITMCIPVNLALRKKSSSICVAIREDLLTKAISFACLATNKLVSLSFFHNVEGSKNLQHTHNQLFSSPALNSPSNSFSPVGPTIFTEPSNFPSCIQQSSAIFSKESRMMDADHTFLTSENPLCTIDPYRHKNIVHCFAQLAAGLPGSSHLGAVAPGSGRATAGEIWLFRKNWARLAVYKLHCRGVVPKASFLRRPGRFEKPGDPLWSF